MKWRGQGEVEGGRSSGGGQSEVEGVIVEWRWSR